MMVQCERQGIGQAGRLLQSIKESGEEKTFDLRPLQGNRTRTKGRAIRMTGKLAYLKISAPRGTLDRVKAFCRAAF